MFRFLYIHQLKVVNTCILIRKSVHQNHQMTFNNSYGNFNVDWDYVLRMSLLTNVYGIPKVLVKMNRRSDNNSVTNQKWKQFKASRQLLKDFRIEFSNLIHKTDYKKALKSHIKIELGYRSYSGILFYSIYYALIYLDTYFLRYLVNKVKHYFNG